jgi:hypothetical protein
MALDDPLGDVVIGMNSFFAPWTVSAAAFTAATNIDAVARMRGFLLVRSARARPDPGAARLASLEGGDYGDVPVEIHPSGSRGSQITLVNAGGSDPPNVRGLAIAMSARTHSSS